MIVRMHPIDALIWLTLWHDVRKLHTTKKVLNLAYILH